MNSNLSIVVTEDGSTTIYNSDKKETYHSIHGAIQESVHVFIKNGYKFCLDRRDNLTEKQLNILEIGFGTGLNALLTLNEIIEDVSGSPSVLYTAIEPNPLDHTIVESLNYPSYFKIPLREKFLQMHNPGSCKELIIHEKFKLNKQILTFSEYRDLQPKFDLVYFDAFSPVTEPDLWTEEVFEKTGSLMNRGGVLVTYCSKGVVRRTLQNKGFRTERLPGPPGKHEMLRAIKE